MIWKSKNKKMIPILAGVVAIVGIITIGVSVTNSRNQLFSKNQETAQINTTQTKSVNKPQQKQDSQYYDEYVESGEKISMPSVDSSNKQEYINYNNPDDFEIFNADGYYFGYPKNYFNSAQKIQNGYQLIANDGAMLKVTVSPRKDESLTLTQEMKQIYDSYLKLFYNPTTSVYRDDENLDYRRFIISGYDSSNEFAGNYVLCNVLNDKIEIYHLINPIEGYSPEEINHSNYILDTIYRECSFSGSSYFPRTYEQYNNNDFGSAK